MASDGDGLRGDITYHPLTADRWGDLEQLFGPRGACGGCWCMWWRLTRSEFERGKGEPNREAFRALVDAGEAPGLLAYLEAAPIAWCSVGPREDYPALERSRVLKRIDAQPVWSVVCLFVARPYRRRGVSVGVLRAAVAHAVEHGARIVEGYPVIPRGSRLPDAFAWTGTLSAFAGAGFVEVARGSETRPIVRYIHPS